MKILAVETATAWLSVAIVDGATVLARADEDAAGAHARKLVPAIDRLLHACGLTLSDLDGLAVSIGPGSFTGLRVGLATMLGFRAVTGLPLAAVPTLEALARNVRDTDRPICPIIKARAGEVYWAEYQWQGAVLQPLGDERVGSLAQMAQSFSRPMIVVGPGWLECRAELTRSFKAEVSYLTQAPHEVMRPSAVAVAQAGLERLQRGEAAGVGIAPRYVQRSQAEVVRARGEAVPPPVNKGRRARRRVPA